MRPATRLFLSACCLIIITILPTIPHAQAQIPGQPQFDDSPPPVGDQVPCMLTHKQSYAARSLGPPPPPSTASVLAQAAESTAGRIDVSKGDQSAAINKKALNSYARTLRSGEYSASTPEALRRALPTLQAQAVADSVQDLPDAQKPAASAAATGLLQQTTNATLSQLGTTFQRPKDVSCSMSVLSWDEAHKSLGRTIADTYIVVQITVRNLDGNNEFLIQDAELAVDANSAQLARFQVGHEKEVARGVLLYGQSYDRQHVFINIVDGIGTILGAVVAIPQPSIDALTGATGSYHAGLVPFLHSLSPDLTTRNLNTLNDLAFSAANASRIVVPKSGSVPFLIFVPVKPLEQACWLQPGYDFSSDTPLSSACDQVCKNSACTNESLQTVIFKHWTPVQLQALGAHSYALIAGIHFKATGQAATLNSITCTSPTDTSGAYLQYAVPSSGLSCALSGTDLDTVSTLRFRSAADSKTNLDAKVTVSGDNTTATAVLPSSETSKIQQPSYELYAVDKSSSERDLNRSVSFRLPPSIAAGQSIPSSGSATLNGSNLVGVSQVVFYDSADSKEVARADALNTTATSISFAVPNAASLPTSKDYAVRFVLGDGASTVFDTKTTAKH